VRDNGTCNGSALAGVRDNGTCNGSALAGVRDNGTSNGSAEAGFARRSALAGGYGNPLRVPI